MLPPACVSDPDEDIGQGRGTPLTRTSQEPNGSLELHFRCHFQGLLRDCFDALMLLFLFNLFFKHVPA